MKQLIYTLLCSFLFVTAATAGGPWTQLRGKGYFKLSEYWIVYDQHYTDAGGLDPNVTTGIFNTYAYAEYGLTDRLTGIFNGALFSRNYMNNLVSATTNEVITPGEALNSIGDIDVGLKYGLTGSGANIPVSVSLILGLPTGKVSGGTLNNLQTGDGEFNQMIQIDAGKSFSFGNHTPAYISAYVGFNNRTENFSEEWRYGIELGTALFNQKLWLIGRFYGVESLKNGATAASIMSTSIFANNSEYTSLGIEANYYISQKIGISAAFAGAFRGEIIAARPSYSVGVFYDLSK